MTDTITEHHEAQLHDLLRAVLQLGGSDLHLHTGERPFIRHNGALVPLDGAGSISTEQMAGIVLVLTERVPARRAEFKEHGEADLSYELEGSGRFRVNAYRERGKVAMTMRAIPHEVPSFDDLDVPEVVKSLALERHGLVLVTGATGSGKTTTLAAMIDHINRNREAHILTIEDPIEIVHPNRRCLISQREVGADTGDFRQALRRALRQDPDVILIGEIRDEETMRTALAAAETGHLVLATLHTINATETISRVLDLFPPNAEQQARSMLAGALKGVVSQRLVRTIDNHRAAAVEVMVKTSRITDCIMNPDDADKLEEAIAAGSYYGMQTFDQALIGMIMKGRIAEDEALRHVTSPQNFRLQLETTKAQAGVAAQRAAAEAAVIQAAAEQAAAEQAAAVEAAAIQAAAEQAAAAEAAAIAAAAAAPAQPPTVAINHPPMPPAARGAMTVPPGGRIAPPPAAHQEAGLGHAPVPSSVPAQAAHPTPPLAAGQTHAVPAPRAGHSHSPTPPAPVPGPPHQHAA